MLTRLTIENYALIDHLEIDFFQGFSAITGETGAGKSILVDALELVLGKRADNQILLDPGRKCVVEAVFSIEKYKLEHFFIENELDYDLLAILRRELSPNGKSRAFINDTPVTLNQLRMLGDQLVDIHAQHATSSLHDPGFQLSVIDNYAGIAEDLSRFETHYYNLKKARATLDELVRKEEEAKKAVDFKTFLLEELESAGLHPEEQESLEEQLTVITHAEEIKSALFHVQGLLSEDEQSCLALLSQAESALQRISPYHPGLETQLQRLKSDVIDLRDIHAELMQLNESIGFSHEQLLVTQQRLDLIYRLQHKHHVNSVAALLEIAEQLRQELKEYSSLEQQIVSSENEIRLLEQELQESAGILSGKRSAAFHSLEQEIISSLQHMGIPEARFEIRHELLPDFKPNGQDKIDFYFNANAGHTMKPLSDVASGGELSRVMLGIKSIISDRKLLPTILFDEIDSGLSGDVAGRVGDVLHSASARMQVIVVTHLPQIAGKAQHHYSVYKLNKNNITYSNIKFLDKKERIAELAKLIGGKEVTPASLAAAEELLTSGSLLKRSLFNN